MLKNLSRLESTVNDKVAHLYLDQDTPLHVVKEMLIEFLTYVGNIEAQVKQQQAAQQPVVTQEAAPVADVALEAVEQPTQAE